VGSRPRTYIYTYSTSTKQKAMLSKQRAIERSSKRWYLLDYGGD